MVTTGMRLILRGLIWRTVGMIPIMRQRCALSAAMAAIFFVVFVCCAGPGCTQVVVDSGEGWVGTLEGSDGNAQGGNYLAGGQPGFGSFRDHFDFIIPTLSGPLTSAMLILQEPGGSLPGHVGPQTSYSVYSLGAFGSYGFTDIGTGAEYGAIHLHQTPNAQQISIQLDVAAQLSITADQGGIFSVGGVDSGETSGVDDFDFAFTAGDDAKLVLAAQSISTPEPGTGALLLAAILCWAAAISGRIRR
jgi:hypothetical protein